MREGAYIFSMVCYRGHNISVLLGGGSKRFVVICNESCQPPPRHNNEWSLIGGRTACVVRMVTGCFCNQLLFRNYFVLCRKRCLCLIQSANSQSAASPNN